MRTSRNNHAIQQGQYNIFMFILLVISYVGVTWGFLVGAPAGALYFGLMTGGTILYVFTLIFVDETNRNNLKQYFRIPLATSNSLSIFSWFLGWMTVIVLNTFFSILGFFTRQSFSINQVFTPFYSANGLLSRGFSQSFQASVLENSPLASWFYQVWAAGPGEEYIFAFIFPVVFNTISIGIVETLFKGKAPFGLANKDFHFLFALTLSVLGFMFIHDLNSTYVGIMFVIAGFFRFIMNSLTYFFGLVLSFIVGFHMSNNNWEWIKTNGFDAFISILFNNGIWGYMFLTIFLGTIVFVLLKRKELWLEFKESLRVYRR